MSIPRNLRYSVGLLLLAFPALLKAESTVTYSDSYAPLITGTGLTQTFELQGFDSSWGILNSVEITYTAGITSLSEFENLANVTGSGYVFKLNSFHVGLGLVALGVDPATFGEGVDWSTAGLDPAVWTGSNFLGYEVGSVSPYQEIAAPNIYDGITDYGGTSGFTRFDTLVDYTTTFSLTSSSDLSYFASPNVVTLQDFGTAIESYFIRGGNNDYVQTTLQTGEVQVTYHYTPVPETSGSLLAGLAGCMLLLRRSR